MEDKALTEAWAWLDEDLRLDTESPIALSHSLWDDFAQDEVVVRSLFPCSTAALVKESVPPALCFDKADSPETSISWDVIHESSPRPFKRRKTIQMDGDDMIDLDSCLTEQIENHSNSFITYENSQCHDLSSSGSMWYMTNEESLSSSIDDAVEPSGEGWMIGCFSDSDTSDAQELSNQWARHIPINAPPPRPNLPVTSDATIPNNTPKNRVPIYPSLIPSRPNQQVTSMRPNTPSVGGSRLKQSSSSANTKPNQPVNGVKPNQSTTNSRASKPPSNLPASKLQIRRSAQDTKPAEPPKPAEPSTNPVLAYPFTLVKPSAIQGDITLQDINQRINTMPPKAKNGSKQSKPTLPPLASGKSVLALTRIHTEGRGTITIMRTRN